MLLLLALDQASKELTVRALEVGRGVAVVPGWFNFVHVRNFGAAWGMLAGFGWLLLVVAVVVAAAVLVNLKRLTEGWPERYYAMFAILAGIAGNSIDRVCRGSVVDFLDFHCRRHHWPAFNVADIAISVGVGVFILSSLIRPAAGKGDGDVVADTGAGGPDRLG
jgi:signal peptidase II